MFLSKRMDGIICEMCVFVCVYKATVSVDEHQQHAFMTSLRSWTDHDYLREYVSQAEMATEE